jgi:CRP-like cAMP-binding protein
MATKRPFDSKSFLAKVGEGRTICKYRKDDVVFSQGDPADAVFYIQKGKVKVTVVSEQGKEAVVAILGADEFCAEGCLAGQPRRIATVSAMTECTLTRLEKRTIIRLLHDQPEFSEVFISHLLAQPRGSKRIWWTSFSIRAKSGLHGFCFCSQISAKRGGRSR